MMDLLKQLEMIQSNLLQIESHLGKHWYDFRDKFLAKTAERENVAQVAAGLESLFTDFPELQQILENSTSPLRTRGVSSMIKDLNKPKYEKLLSQRILAVRTEMEKKEKENHEKRKNKA